MTDVNKDDFINLLDQSESFNAPIMDEFFADVLDKDTDGKVAIAEAMNVSLAILLIKSIL